MDRVALVVTILAAVCATLAAKARATEIKNRARQDAKEREAIHLQEEARAREAIRLQEEARAREELRLLKEARAREAIRLQEEARIPENFQYVPRHVTGLDSQVEEIARKLDSTKTLGLVGMGGLGKTTLAKAVFNRLAADFEYTCFIPDVKFIDGDEQAVFDKIKEHMHFHGKKVQQENRKEWTTKPFLLVLDDISGERDLSVLSQIDDTTVTESRIIFTTRKSPFGYEDKVYKVDVLDSVSAKQLFLSYAFADRKTPPTELKGLLNDIVRKCEGLPLALKVLGKFLRSTQDYEIWKETLDGMDRADVESNLNQRLWAKLKLSYDGLEEKTQQMFLEAATFFVSGDWTLRAAKAAWRVAYDTQTDNLWKQLVMSSMVYDVGDHERIKIPEQLQSLGRQIARDSINTDKWWRWVGDEGRDSINTDKWREWDGDEGLKLLQNTEELQKRKIFAMQISLESTHVTTHTTHTTILSFMELQFLEANAPTRAHGVLDDKLVQSKFVRLRCEALVSKVLLHPSLGANIVLLNLIWEESCLPTCIGLLSKLRFLVFGSETLTILPDEIENLSQLEYLKFSNCSNLQTLPGSFGNLSALQHLEISWCRELRTLPESFGNLSALQRLKFICCPKLQTLPESFGNLLALQHLEIDQCDG